MRHKHQFHASITLAILVLLAASAPAAILEYRAEFGNPINSVQSSPIGFTGLFNYTYLTQFQLIGPTPTLTGTLDPGDQFRIVYSAPSGYLFNILPPPSGSFDFGFTTEFWTRSGITYTPGDVNNTTVSFVGASVPTPLPSFVQFEHGLPGEKLARVVFASGGFSFKSIVITNTIPEGVSDGFINFTPAVLRFEVYSSSSREENARSLATLIPEPNANVPEPASIFLVTSAMGVFALARHKRIRV